MSELASISIMKEIECSVCLLTLDDPIILPCSHSFCRKCTMDLFQGETLQCPFCKQNHCLSSDKLLPNFLLRKIIKKISTGGKLKSVPINVGTSDEIFCESCLFPVNKFDPMHAECNKISVKEGNWLVQQREEAIVGSENQPKVIGDNARKSNKEKVKVKQAIIKGLKGEVNKAADEIIGMVNKHREYLNNKIEEKYSSDIEKLQKNSEEISKKIEEFEVFKPERSEKLIMRINKLRAAELAMNEFQLPNLEPLEDEVLAFRRNILTVDKFSFGELVAPQLTADDLPVFLSKICSDGFNTHQYILHPVPAQFPVSEELRQVAVHSIRLLEMQSVARVWIDWKAGDSSSKGLPQQSKQMEVDGRQVALDFGGPRWWGEMRDIVGDFIFCAVMSPHSQHAERRDRLDATNELRELIATFNNRNASSDANYGTGKFAWVAR